MRLIGLGDLHFGSSNMNGNEKGFLLDVIEWFKPELFIITGDYWNKVYPADHPAIIEGLSFYRNLLNVLDPSCVIRVIKGTNEHDGEQPRLLSTLSEGRNFRYYPTISFEEIDGMAILFIPEEYVGEGFYDSWFPENYVWDLIALHGMTDLHAGYSSEVEKHSRAATSFKNKQLRDAATLAIASHVHIPVQHENFISLGTPSRFVFGEEEPKGIWVHDLQKGSYQSQFYENPYAPGYNTYPIAGSAFDKENFEALAMATLERLQYENIRFAVSEFNESQNSMIHLFTKTIRERNTSGNVFKIKREKIKIKQPIESKEDDKTSNDILTFDPSKLPMTEAVQNYIKDQFNTTVPVDVILHYLKGDKNGK